MLLNEGILLVTMVPITCWRPSAKPKEMLSPANNVLSIIHF